VDELLGKITFVALEQMLKEVSSNI